MSLNGQVVGGRPSGYAEFHVDLDDALRHGADNEVVVTVDTSDEPNSRWYSGSGLYRRVWLEVDGRSESPGTGCGSARSGSEHLPRSRWTSTWTGFRRLPTPRWTSSSSS